MYSANQTQVSLKIVRSEITVKCVAVVRLVGKHCEERQEDAWKLKDRNHLKQNVASFSE